MGTKVNKVSRFGLTAIAAVAMTMTFGTVQQAEATSVHWTNSGYTTSPSLRSTPSFASLLSRFGTQRGSSGSFSSSSSSSVSASASASASASSSGGVVTVIQTSTSGGGSASASAGGSVGGSSSGSSSVAPVPLPAGGALLLAALGGFAALRRRNTAA